MNGGGSGGAKSGAHGGVGVGEGVKGVNGACETMVNL